MPINGITFGKHPLITRLLKAIYKQRPSLPKYTVTYDVNIVLEYLKTLPQNRDNSLEIHTKKLATLMCLLSGQRSQTLGVLTLDAMHLTEMECTFYISKLVKTSRPKFHTSPLQFQSYPEDHRLCVVLCLRDYIERTKEFRSKPDSGPLFVSFSKPFQPVTSTTIARWVKAVLPEAGINTTTFTAHSTRSASSSAVKEKGLSLKEISKAAGWTNAETFRIYYNKPIVENFGAAVLRT